MRGKPAKEKEGQKVENLMEKPSLLVDLDEQSTLAISTYRGLLWRSATRTLVCSPLRLRRGKGIFAIATRLEPNLLK